LCYWGVVCTGFDRWVEMELQDKEEESLLFLLSLLELNLNKCQFPPTFSAKSWRQPGTKEKTTYKINCKWFIIKWAQLGSNQRPPDYEFQIGISIRLHRFVSLCTSISGSTLNVKNYIELHGFEEILALKLAHKYQALIWVYNLLICFEFFVQRFQGLVQAAG